MIKYIAGGRFIKPRQHTDDGTLAAAAFADEGNYMAAVQFQVGALDGLDDAAGKRAAGMEVLGQTDGFKDGLLMGLAHRAVSGASTR